MDADSERAFEQFVRERSAALFRTAYLVTGDAHQAEDLVQSAFERAYRRWRRIRSMDYPEAYVRRMVVNLANDRRRFRRGRDEVALEESTSTSGPDGTALVDLRQALLVGLRQLPVGMRTVLVLRYWEGLSEALVLLPEALLVHQPGQPAPPAEPVPIYDAVRADWLQVSYDDPVTAPRAGALPRRTPMAHLNSLLRDPPATPPPGALDQRPARTPDQVRSLLTSFQNGIREARSLLEA